MLKIVYPICCGMDVHKNFLVACIAITDDKGITTYKNKILESDCNIVLAHPKYVKAIRGKKTDKKDAKWIADIFKHVLVNGSFIPQADISQLRDLMRYRYKLTNFTTGEKNRVQNCITVSNLKLDAVFSDVFGKASSNIVSYMLDNQMKNSLMFQALELSI